MKDLFKKSRTERIGELQRLLVLYAEAKMVLNKTIEKAIKELDELEKES